MDINYKYKYLGILPVVILILIFAFKLFSENNISTFHFQLNNESANSGYYFPYLQTKDTIYLLGDNYIEIILNKQRAVLNRKNDSSITYKISSGNDKIPKGEETPDGLYTVQSKSPMAISKQFKNAELYHWIGFNGNVGFHGLKGNGYYNTLGIRPSSHGCVRIARDDAEDLYKKIKLGTPVVVFHNEPAFVIKFAGSREYNPAIDYFLERGSKYNNIIMKKRIDNLYKGKALRNNIGKIFIDGQTILKSGGLNLGLAENISRRQALPITFKRHSAEIDNLQYNNVSIVSKDTTTKKKK